MRLGRWRGGGGLLLVLRGMMLMYVLEERMVVDVLREMVWDFGRVMRVVLLNEL